MFPVQELLGGLTYEYPAINPSQYACGRFLFSAFFLCYFSLGQIFHMRAFEGNWSRFLQATYSPCRPTSSVI